MGVRVCNIIRPLGPMLSFRQKRSQSCRLLVVIHYSDYWDAHLRTFDKSTTLYNNLKLATHLTISGNILEENVPMAYFFYVVTSRTAT